MMLSRLKIKVPLSLLAGWIAGDVLTAHAQRSFTLTVAPTNQNGVVVKWPAQSATPVGDLPIVPQFQYNAVAISRRGLRLAACLPARLGKR